MPQDQDRRQQLTQCATEWFARHGYHNTKVSDVVKSAGVSQGTFYWYFQSKEQLAVEIIEIGKDKLTKVIEEGYRQHAGSEDDMVASSARLLKHLFEFADQNRYLMALLLIKGQGADQPVREAVSQTWIAFEHAFKSNVERAIELEMLPHFANVPLRVNILVSLITGVLTKWLFGPMSDVEYLSPYSSEEIAEETARFEIRGLLGI